MAIDAATAQASLRVTGVLNILLGAWIFVSPWVYGAGNSNAWNSWIVGALIALFAACRLASPIQDGLAGVNMILGAWIFISPWVYGYKYNQGRFVNSLCAGAIVFILSVIAASAHGDRGSGIQPRT